MNDLMDSGVFLMDIFETFRDFSDHFRSRKLGQDARRQRRHLRICRIWQQHVAQGAAASLQQDDHLILTIDATEILHHVL